MRKRALGLVVAALVTAPAAAADPGPALSIDAGAGRHAISPDIYGWNFAPSPLAGEIDLPVDRRGGNSADTLNWKTGTQNTGNDYFFENIPWCWSGDYGYCSIDGSHAHGFHAYTDQIDADQQIGAKTLLDVPMMDWVAADPATYAQPLPCSFPRSAFPTQDSFGDTYDPDCGNGKHNDAWVTNTPQVANAVANGPDFQGDWVDDLKTRYGSAADGGVAFYELGNEPGLWNDTHHDWHPDPVGYDELWAKSHALAKEIKSRDPSAAVLAFSEWGWLNYFCSSKDNLSNGCQPTDTDRNAHGGMELAAWLLKQFKDNEQADGGRLIDYLDLHYYRQGGAGIAPTRSLWDPGYVDPSWIDATIKLLPRMHDWVDQYYPGTKISLSEYDLSDGDADEDNLIEADVLGIFARERLDLATLWPQTDVNHYADAFRLFRNYDGVHSKFGETYVSSQSADQSALSVYGAERSTDGALTLVVINKSFSELTSHVSLAGVLPSASAQTWRWTSTAGGIARGADLDVTSSGFDATFAPRSMTMVVIPKAPAPPSGGELQGGGPGPDQSGGTPGQGAGPVPTAPRPAVVRCKVPKLKGLTLKKTKAKLKKAHCRLGKVAKKKSRVRKGRVIRQTPKAGSVRGNGARVNVVLSRGR